MEQLREAIERQGVGIGTDIVKVDMFLNHRIDTGLLFAMGEAWADAFRADKPDLVLTVEASGIAMAVAAAHALGDLPVVFAKKSATVVQNADAVQAPVYSFTHKTQNMIRIDKRYLPENSRVLIIDDFLADGEAARGMMLLCEKRKAVVVGVGIGGNFNKAALMAKKALLRPMGQHNDDPFYAEMEERLLTRINDLGIGPQGFGGSTTALAVNVIAAPTHIAGLPVAVNINCHVSRHEERIL